MAKVIAKAPKGAKQGGKKTPKTQMGKVSNPELYAETQTVGRRNTQANSPSIKNPYGTSRVTYDKNGNPTIQTQYGKEEQKILDRERQGVGKAQKGMLDSLGQARNQAPYDPRGFRPSDSARYNPDAGPARGQVLDRSQLSEVRRADSGQLGQRGPSLYDDPRIQQMPEANNYNRDHGLMSQGDFMGMADRAQMEYMGNTQKLMGDQFRQQRAMTQEELTNRGIPLGADQYNRQMSRVAQDQNNTMLQASNDALGLGRELRQQYFDEDLKRGTYGREGAKMTRDEQVENATQSRLDNSTNFDQTMRGRDQDWGIQRDTFDMDLKRRNMDRTELNDQFRQANDNRADYRAEQGQVWDQAVQGAEIDKNNYNAWYDKPMDRASDFAKLTRGPQDPGQATFQPTNISGDYWGETQSRRNDATARYGINKRGSGGGDQFSFEQEMELLNQGADAQGEVDTASQPQTDSVVDSATTGFGTGLGQGVQNGRKTAMGRAS